jgi:Glycosyl transferase family 2
MAAPRLRVDHCRQCRATRSKAHVDWRHAGRNEALVLRDTLDYVGRHVDAIVAYDDASTDQTLEILHGHPKVALIVANGSWEEDIKARRIAEGRHRGLLLQIARTQLQFDWMFCFDANERVSGICAASREGRALAIATAYGFGCSMHT